MAKSELTTKCTEQENICESLKQEKRDLQQCNSDLVPKLQELEGEHNRLKAVYGSVVQQLSQLRKCQSEVDAMCEVMTAKTAEAVEEKDTLQKILDEIAEELEHHKAQVL